MITLTFIICLFCSILTAPPNPGGCIFRTEAIMPYEVIWNAICAVESGFNPMAIGDKHLKEHSYGIVQIRQSRLDDYYNQTGIRYNVTDMFDPMKAKQVFMYYCISSDLEVIARTWNGGSRGMEKKATLEYWQKIKLNL